MSKELVILAFGAAVAVGTLIYYAFFDNKEKEKPMAIRSSRSSKSKNLVPDIQYQHDPSRNQQDISNRDNFGTITRRKLPISENSTHSSSNSSQECKVCVKTANAEFLPCRHVVFCHEHAEFYFGFNGKEGRNIAKCPHENCRIVIEGIA